LSIGIEKTDIYEGVTVKALLNSGTTGMFMDKRMVVKHEFRLQKLERPIMVRNINVTNNSRKAITRQVKANVYYKGHMKRMRIDVCNLGKTEVILGMPWLQAYNPEINWEIGEVKIMRCLPLCGRIGQKKQERKVEREKRIVTLEEEKIVKWTIDDKEDWGKKEEIEEDHRKIEELVPRKFFKWRKVFGKVESKIMLTRKTLDHNIDLKEMFKLWKGRIYSLFKDEKEEVQKFVDNQLRKGYIRPSKSPQTSPVFFVGKKDGNKQMVIDYLLQIVTYLICDWSFWIFKRLKNVKVDSDKRCC